MKRIVLKDQYGPISVYLLPFLKPAAVRHALQRDDINTYEEGVMAALQECEDRYDTEKCAGGTSVCDRSRQK
mgnify:CR=1 FL=1